MREMEEELRHLQIYDHNLAYKFRHVNIKFLTRVRWPSGKDIYDELLLIHSLCPPLQTTEQPWWIISNHVVSL